MRILPLVFLSAFMPLTSSCNAETTEVKAESTQSSSTPEISSNFKVVNVDDNDVLNLRAAPNSSAEIVFPIPSDASNLIFVGKNDKWVNVMYRGHRGWVYHKYVEKISLSTVGDFAFTANLHCIGTEPHWVFKSDGNQALFKFQGTSKNLLLNDAVKRSANSTNSWKLSYTIETGYPDTFELIIQKKSCSDGMSDTAYPYSLHLLDSKTGSLYDGCCKTR